jgi:hypothetical protein
MTTAISMPLSVEDEFTANPPTIDAADNRGAGRL